jgi:hypothetical protein
MYIIYVSTESTLIPSDNVCVYIYIQSYAIQRLWTCMKPLMLKIRRQRQDSLVGLKQSTEYTTPKIGQYTNIYIYTYMYVCIYIHTRTRKNTLHI